MVCFVYVCIFFPCSFNIILSATPYICLSYCLQLIFPEVQCNKRFSEAMIWFVRKIWCVQWTLSICSLFTNPQCCHTHTQTKVIYVFYTMVWANRFLCFCFLHQTYKHSNVIKKIGLANKQKTKTGFYKLSPELREDGYEKANSLGQNHTDR